MKAFICFVKKTKDKRGKQTEEIRYYISSTDVIELCATAIRGRWSVENNLHWHLDYSLYEDNNSTMDKTAFNNYSLINKMVLVPLQTCKAGHRQPEHTYFTERIWLGI